MALRPTALTVALAVAAGSALGGSARFVASLAALALAGPAFPLATLLVNLAGSFLIAFHAARVATGTGRSALRDHFVMTGFCGGFTTFSIFSYETLLLLRAGGSVSTALFVTISVAVWLAAAWLGFRLGERPRGSG